MSLSQEKRDELAKILSGKGVKAICPMCGNNSFNVGAAYFNNPLQDSLESFNIGGPSVPTVPIICTKCGFVSQHAVGILGLLLKTEKDKEDGK